MNKAGELNAQAGYAVLQVVQEACRVLAVHLRVVKLKRYGERCLEKPAPVSAPNHERFVVDAAIHTHRAVYIVLRQGRCAYHHAVWQVVVLARMAHLAG